MILDKWARAVKLLQEIHEDVADLKRNLHEARTMAHKYGYEFTVNLDDTVRLMGEEIQRLRGGPPIVRKESIREAAALIDCNRAKHLAALYRIESVPKIEGTVHIMGEEIKRQRTIIERWKAMLS